MSGLTSSSLSASLFRNLHWTHLQLHSGLDVGFVLEWKLPRPPHSCLSPLHSTLSPLIRRWMILGSLLSQKSSLLPGLRRKFLFIVQEVRQKGHY